MSSAGQCQHAADRHRQHADAIRVAGRVRIARVERGRKRADGAGVRGLGVCASASATDAISALNVSVSASSSRLDPVERQRARTSRDAAIAASDVDSRPIGSASSCASATLPSSASETAPTAITRGSRIARRIAPRDDSSIDPSA